MPYVVERRMSIQYDGTNGAYICGEWSDGGLTLIADDGQSLTLQATAQPGYEYTVQVTDWVIAAPPSWLTFAPDAQYKAQWLELPV